MVCSIVCSMLSGAFPWRGMIQPKLLATSCHFEARQGLWSIAEDDDTALDQRLRGVDNGETLKNSHFILFHSPERFWEGN